MKTNDLVSAGKKIGRIHAIVGKTIFVKFLTKAGGHNIFPFVARQVKVIDPDVPHVNNVIPNPIIHPVPKY